MKDIINLDKLNNCISLVLTLNLNKGANQMDYEQEEEKLEGFIFANPGSALRSATKTNPRNLPCPNCKEPNVLTRKDVTRGYQCDNCANAEEGCY